MSRRVIQPEHTDVWRHLATEEYLLETLPPATSVLYLWRSAPCVVLGKHQNPWLECRVTDLTATGVVLARRLSGGGAVYHDLGNLNFSFIGWAATYDKQACSALVVAALRRIGVDASVGPRHILTTADGRKFSGSAYCYRHQKVLHHGTLLVDTDLRRLEACLRPACAGLECRGIRSIPTAVVNLREVAPGLTVAAVAAALAAEFGGAATPAVDASELTELATRYRSWDWCFGRTPKFTVRGTVPATRPRVAFTVEVEHGVVGTIATADTRFATTWTGQRFDDLLAAVPSLRVGG